MASILDRYGIKEVADVTFYEIDENGNRSVPVLYLDTLKVSTIEQTAETSDARGGKGNPKLITWDYGKDITVTLEDALFSAKSLSIMFGNGNVTTDHDDMTVHKTAVAKVTASGDGEGKTYDVHTFIADVYVAEAGKVIRKEIQKADASTYGISNIKIYAEDATETSEPIASFTSANEDQRVFVTYDITVKSKSVISISADSFPGTYYVTGDTYARSDVTGDDQFFQFIIPKAKVTSENTITLEAEGDPSVFNMNLTVLRPTEGDMMKLVQYTL